MIRVRTDIRFPMPTTFTFLPVRLGDRNLHARFAIHGDFELGNIEQFPQRILMLLHQCAQVLLEVRHPLADGLFVSR